MSITYSNAVDSIFDTFLTYWDANIASVSLDHTPEIRWRNKEEEGRINPGEHWLRVRQTTVTERQSALKSDNKIFESIGLVVVELYYNKSTLVLNQDRAMATIARDAFRKSTNPDVWFRNERIQELPPEETYYRNNVIAEYRYTERI